MVRKLEGVGCWPLTTCITDARHCCSISVRPSVRHMLVLCLNVTIVISNIVESIVSFLVTEDRCAAACPTLQIISDLCLL